MLGMPPLGIKRLLRKTFRASPGPLRSRKIFRPARLTPSLRRHAAALKAVAASAATRLYGDANPASGQPQAGRARKDPPKSNETTITIAGNLVDDLRLQFTTAAQPYARFRIASTPRYRDAATGEWKDGDTLFLTCVAWRLLAENIAESLDKVRFVLF